MFTEMMASGTSGSGGDPISTLLDTVLTVSGSSTVDTGVHCDNVCAVYVYDSSDNSNRNVTVHDNMGNSVLMFKQSNLFESVVLSNGNIGVKNNYSTYSISIKIVGD